MNLLKSDLEPPRSGPNRNPILHGVASALAQLFPPVQPAPRQPEDKRDRSRSERT